jgi:hypothetical protein
MRWDSSRRSPSSLFSFSFTDVSQNGNYDETWQLIYWTSAVCLLTRDLKSITPDLSGRSGGLWSCIQFQICTKMGLLSLYHTAARVTQASVSWYYPSASDIDVVVWFVKSQLMSKPDSSTECGPFLHLRSCYSDDLAFLSTWNLKSLKTVSKSVCVCILSTTW